jgi:ribosome maturation factor RimP
MEFRKKIEELLNEFLEARGDLFLVDLKISAGDDITVILDGDNGVTLQDCLDASRAIEFNMDREEHDFSLQVMSAGLSEPLSAPRQFKKNFGREIEVLLNDSSKIEGELAKVDDEKITLILRYRKPKDIGKGKVDVEEEKEIPYSEIKKALGLFSTSIPLTCKNSTNLDIEILNSLTALFNLIFGIYIIYCFLILKIKVFLFYCLLKFI